MSQSYDSYTNIAKEFIGQIQKHSPTAADCIKQIQTQYGARAAYLAAFALVMLRERLNRTGYSSLSNALKTFSYYEEMRDNTDAIRLYEEAAAHLFSPQVEGRNPAANMSGL